MYHNIVQIKPFGSWINDGYLIDNKLYIKTTKSCINTDLSDSYLEVILTDDKIPFKITDISNINISSAIFNKYNNDEYSDIIAYAIIEVKESSNKYNRDVYVIGISTNDYNIRPIKIRDNLSLLSLDVKSYYYKDRLYIYDGYNNIDIISHDRCINIKWMIL